MHFLSVLAFGYSKGCAPLPDVRQSCIPSCCVAFLPHIAKFCEKFVNFEWIFLYEPCLIWLSWLTRYQLPIYLVFICPDVNVMADQVPGTIYLIFVCNLPFLPLSLKDSEPAPLLVSWMSGFFCCWWCVCERSPRTGYSVRDPTSHCAPSAISTTKSQSETDEA